MTHDQIAEAVCAYLVGIGAPAERVVLANRGATRLTSAYLTVQVVDDTPVGLPEVVTGTVGGSYAMQSREHIQVRVSVNAIGSDAVAWLTAARGRWREPSGPARALRDAGVHPYRWSQVRDLTAFEDAAFQPRWQADMLAYAVRTHGVSDDVDVTRSVVVDVDVSRESGVSLTAHVEVEAP